MSLTAQPQPQGQPLSVQFLFDPLCPWAWRTSLWVRHVQRLRPISVDWRVLSLAYVNRENTDASYRERLSRHGLALRMLELARREVGNDAMDRLYLSLGQARHDRSEDLSELAVLRRAATEAGLPATFLDATRTHESMDADLEEQYADATRDGAFGVPTLRIGQNRLIFGPVLDRVPEGDEAATLWDDVVRVAARPYFFELKRTRAT